MAEPDKAVFFKGFPLLLPEASVRQALSDGVGEAGEVVRVRVFKYEDGTSKGMGCAELSTVSAVKRLLKRKQLSGYRVESYRWKPA